MGYCLFSLANRGIEVRGADKEILAHKRICEGTSGRWISMGRALANMASAFPRQRKRGKWALANSVYIVNRHKRSKSHAK